MTLMVSDQSFEKEVLTSNILVLVDFYADWCGPCKAIAPSIEELAKEYEGKVKVVKMNIEENPETPSEYAVRSIPTLMLFKNGQIIDTKVGGYPKAVLSSWLEQNIA